MSEYPQIKATVQDAINVAREKAKLMLEKEEEKRMSDIEERARKENERLSLHKPLRDEIMSLVLELISKRRTLYEKRLELALALCPMRPGDVFSTRGWQATGVYQVIQVIPDDESPESDWAILCRRLNKFNQLGASVVKLQSRTFEQQFEIIPDRT